MSKGKRMRTSTWVLGDGTVAQSPEWLCPDCHGYHVVALGGIRVGHSCPRTEAPDPRDERIAELEKLVGRCEEALLVPDPHKERELLADLKADRNKPLPAAAPQK